MSQPGSKSTNRPAPRWLRLLLMAVLVATVCLAFYLTFDGYIAETQRSSE